MFDFSKLLNWQYLSDPNPPAQFEFKNLALIIFGLIIIISVILWFLAHYLIKKSKLTRIFLQTKVFYLFLTLGIVGLALTFFRIVGASYLSMRLFLLVYLLAMLAWAVYLVFYLIFSFPKEYREEIDQRRREKYLPRKSKLKIKK